MGKEILEIRLRCLEEHRKLPQCATGESPIRKQVLVHFDLEKTSGGNTVILCELPCEILRHTIVVI